MPSVVELLDRRLSEARARLRAALIAGDPTDVHRAAIGQLEQDIARERSVQKQADDTAARHRNGAVADRAAAISGEARRRVADLIARFPLTSES